MKQYFIEILVLNGSDSIYVLKKFIASEYSDVLLVIEEKIQGYSYMNLTYVSNNLAEILKIQGKIDDRGIIYKIYSSDGETRSYYVNNSIESIQLNPSEFSYEVDGKVEVKMYRGNRKY